MPAPYAVSGPCTLVTQTSATFGATIDTYGSPTTYHFEYGPTRSYGQVTPTADAGSTAGVQVIKYGCTGLPSGPIFHYQVVATNASGTTRGGDDWFYTVPPDVLPPGMAIGSHSGLIGGVPTAPGSGTIVVTATDTTTWQSASAHLVIVVNP